MLVEWWQLSQLLLTNECTDAHVPENGLVVTP
jgi:hypothetical protein